jgi:hypothetical protein
VSIQFGVTAANNFLDNIEATVGTAPILTIRSGAAPANCAAANSGTVLATITLPSDWMAAAASGSKAKSGTWQDASADAAGTAAHYRLHDSTGVTCHQQGTVTVTGGGGDLTLDDITIEAAQIVTITTWTWTAQT